MDTHLTTCPEVVIPCTHARFGCGWSGERSTLEAAHLRTCPYEAIAPFLQMHEQQTALVDELRTELIQCQDQSAEDRMMFAVETEDLRRLVGALADDMAQLRASTTLPLPSNDLNMNMNMNANQAAFQGVRIEMDTFRKDLDLVRAGVTELGGTVDQRLRRQDEQLMGVTASIRNLNSQVTRVNNEPLGVNGVGASISQTNPSIAALWDEVKGLRAELGAVKSFNKALQMQLQANSLQLQQSRGRRASDESDGKARSWIGSFEDQSSKVTIPPKTNPHDSTTKL
ncbi:hypothetical protein HDU76_006570 [Blyttiomyces sp. JEL0837]|nr:hypothetical protein HDU76_006570 [Blyttiomyces sp. JEL0837]